MPYDPLDDLSDHTRQANCSHYWEPCYTETHPNTYPYPAAYRVKRVYCKYCLKERAL